MEISLGLSITVMLAGFSMLFRARRWDTIAAIAYGVGLLATLLMLAVHIASLHIGK